MKKNSTIVLIVIAVLLIAVGAILMMRGRKTTETSNNNQQNQQETVETPLEEKPFVSLAPRADGKEFTLDITRIKNTQTIEYELVYDSQGLSRGVIGSVDLKGEDKVQRKLLLGSCSKSVCKYDEGVEQGTLTLRFRGSDGTRKFTSDFHLQQGGKELTSIDEKFKLAGKFSTNTFYLTMSTVGLPEQVENKVVAEPYGIFTAGSSSVKNSTLTMTFSETPTSAKLFLFDGGKSTEQTGAKIEDSNLNATVNSLGTFFATE